MVMSFGSSGVDGASSPSEKFLLTSNLMLFALLNADAIVSCIIWSSDGPACPRAYAI